MSPRDIRDGTRSGEYLISVGFWNNGATRKCPAGFGSLQFSVQVFENDVRKRRPGHDFLPL